MSAISWPELLRDPLWQFVGVVLAVAALAAAIVIFLLQRQRKILLYQVVAANRLLSVREELEGRLRVTFDMHEVRDLSLLVFDVVNAGDAPIRAADFESSVAFSFGEAARVLLAEVVDDARNGVPATLTAGDRSVELAPLLLNPRDVVRVKVLLSDFDGVVEAKGRIAGVSSIDISPTNTPTDWVLMVFVVVMFCLGFAFMQDDPKSDSASTGFTFWAGPVCFGLATLASIVGQIRDRKSSKQLLGNLRRRDAKQK